MPDDQAADLEAARSTVVALFGALAAGDSERASELLHTDVVWTPMRISGLGVLRTRQDAERWVSQYGPGFGKIGVEVSRMLAVGEWIVVLGTVEDNRRLRGARGRKVGWRVAVRDGLVVEAHASDTWEEAKLAAERSAPAR